MKQNKLSKLLAVAGLVTTIGLTNHAYASAFQLFDQDASQLGNDYAGSVASAKTPGTEYYNAAGMTHLTHTQMSFGATAINTNIKFTGKTVVDGGATPTTNSVAQGGGLSVLPNFHVVMPLENHWAVGFGLTVPFGLETNYPSYSPAANAATRTSIRAINLGLSVAHQVTHWMSVGFGLDEQRAQGIFDQSPTVLAVAHEEMHNQLTDWAIGWHAGLLFDLSKDTRVGINYRSKINHKATGTSEAMTDSLFHRSNDIVSTQIILPPTTSFGVYSDLNKKWGVMAKADYTQWDTIKDIILDNVATGPTGNQTIELPQNYKDTWNLAIGADYHITKQWTWKMGGGFDQSPVNDSDRNLRLPDNDHYILSTGVEYKANDNFTMDLGYEHVFLKNAHIHNTATKVDTRPVAITIEEEGGVSASADLIGAQITWKFI